MPAFLQCRSVKANLLLFRSRLRYPTRSLTGRSSVRWGSPTSSPWVTAWISTWMNCWIFWRVTAKPVRSCFILNTSATPVVLCRHRAARHVINPSWSSRADAALQHRACCIPTPGWIPPGMRLSSARVYCGYRTRTNFFPPSRR